MKGKIKIEKKIIWMMKGRNGREDWGKNNYWGWRY